MFTSYTDEQIEARAAELAAACGRDWDAMHTLYRRHYRIAAREQWEREADMLAIAYERAAYNYWWAELGRSRGTSVTTARTELDAAIRAAAPANERALEHAREVLRADRERWAREDRARLRGQRPGREQYPRHYFLIREDGQLVTFPASDMAEAARAAVAARAPLYRGTGPMGRAQGVIIRR